MCEDWHMPAVVGVLLEVHSMDEKIIRGVDDGECCSG